MSFSRFIAGTMKWGIWGSNFSTDQIDRMIKVCIDSGVTTFDHADIYGDYTTEEAFGATLKMDATIRKQIKIITKCGIQKVSVNRPLHKIKSYNTSAKHIIQSVENSLENFGTDYLDCLLLHRPDLLMDVHEVAAAFDQLKQSGKVLSFGVSNFKESQVELLSSVFPLKANQIQCSILELEPFLDGTLDLCQQKGIVPMAWSPLGGGNLFLETDNERNRRIIAVARLLSEQYNCVSDVILLNWLLLHPSNIHPVLGTTNPDRIKLAQEALNFKITREDWYLLWRASTGREVA